ncbi:hypothetical protein AQUCO_02700282v1 [Aquilegia coerulea]|uniref:Uncharacterized protein n=1 Tax=Aquilegia coerulea TaxID=218851 RepID=A0A2G5D661_AQUCA|nr:hypothetical protein AQUCO_02700282v1 [Aquilegia coerulea]
MQMTASLVVCGHKVYCLDKLGGLLIFDIASLVWREIPGNAELIPFDIQWFIMESEKGEILKINRGSDLKTFSFYKFIDSKSAWEELGDDDIEDRSWFIYDRNNHFTVKKTGVSKKVYEFDKFYNEVRNGALVESPNIHVYDLFNGSLQSYPHREGEWVDLGWMDKVTCSCKRYVPRPISMH